MWGDTPTVTIYNSRNYKGLLDRGPDAGFPRIYNSRNYKGLLDNYVIHSCPLIYNSRNYKGLLDAVLRMERSKSTTVEIIRVS